ncbi:hypothetical protein IV203_017126 [Nitzschia inconspicua]|uniref:Uncharacterized protein n=1 Tax=Nitzschia inconspicua TaxID=303405 RepID=A0A9K3KRY0_9STRA|nr:hypothetical protein IV203_017126 [Nitzschia inconspicua]
MGKNRLHGRLLVRLGVIAALGLSALNLLPRQDHFHVSAFVLTTSPIIQRSAAQTHQSTSTKTRFSFSKLGENILDRFTDPKIEDPMLPLTEAGIAQIVAPTLELFWLKLNQSPFPSWAQPLYDYTFTPRGALLAPTLVHGAGLACAWLLGCLAAKGYQREAYESDALRVISTTLKAGAFACGILILATQFDLYREMGGYVQVGDSAETDLRIYRALVELIDDIFFEAVTLLGWRLFRSRVA